MMSRINALNYLFYFIKYIKRNKICPAFGGRGMNEQTTVLSKQFEVAASKVKIIGPNMSFCLIGTSLFHVTSIY